MTLIYFINVYKDASYIGSTIFCEHIEHAFDFNVVSGLSQFITQLKQKTC